MGAPKLIKSSRPPPRLDDVYY